MSDAITVALPKGRLFDPCIQLFADAGCAIDGKAFDGRRLSVESADAALRFIAVKPWDVPVYVEYGIADLGVTGADVILERDADVYVPLTLPFGACRLVVAMREGEGAPARGRTLRVATKYPYLTTEYFNARGTPVEVIPLQGSVELAPVLGLADRIVDLVETGATLAANGLVVEEEMDAYSAQIIVCRSSLLTRAARLRPLLDRLAEAQP